MQKRRNLRPEVDRGVSSCLEANAVEFVERRTIWALPRDNADIRGRNARAE